MEVFYDTTTSVTCQEQSGQTTETHEDRSRVGQVIMPLTYTRPSHHPLVKPNSVSYRWVLNLEPNILPIVLTIWP